MSRSCYWLWNQKNKTLYHRFTKRDDNHLNTVIIAPMTTTIRNYPCRTNITFQGKKGEVALDQIKAVDKTRIIKFLGTINKNSSQKITNLLQEIFS